MKVCDSLLNAKYNAVKWSFHNLEPKRCSINGV